MYINRCFICIFKRDVDIIYNYNSFYNRVVHSSSLLFITVILLDRFIDHSFICAGVCNTVEKGIIVVNANSLMTLNVLFVLFLYYLCYFLNMSHCNKHNLLFGMIHIVTIGNLIAFHRFSIIFIVFISVYQNFSNTRWATFQQWHGKA